MEREQEPGDDRQNMSVVHCGACEKRSLKVDAENAADHEHGPNVPHCPRCGTTLDYDETTVEHWVNRSIDTSSELRAVEEADQPFERIQPHKDVLDDIGQMQENLDELEQAVRRAEWLALGGRGAIRLERVEKLCDAVSRSMPHIREDIFDLPRSPDAATGGDDDGK